MSKTFSINTFLSWMTADELETLRHTHETILIFNYDQEELNIDECGFVAESLEEMGLEVQWTKAACKTNRALKVFVPYGGKIVS